MTRAEFLNSLYRRLGALEKEQAEQHLAYYAEMLMDRMEEGMSEEEAVASMEDVETIASRILQDEGRADAPQAPAFPDMPKGEAGQFTHVPAKPRRNWRKAAQAALWAVAIVVAVHTAWTRLAGFGSHTADASTSTYVMEATDVAPGAGVAVSEEEVRFDSVLLSPEGITLNGEGRLVHIGPDGLYVEGQERELTSGWGTSGGIWEVPADYFVDSVYVNWTGGEVAVQGWDEDYIQFQEYGSGEPAASRQLTHQIEDGQLTIESGGAETKLLLRLPRDTLNTLTIDSFSWDVLLENVAAQNLSVTTSSGNVTMSGAAAAELWVDTYSGNVRLQDAAAETLLVEAGSGNVAVENTAAALAEITTSSGWVEGTLDAKQAWLDTTSGDVALTVDGAVELTAETTSGDVTLNLPGGAASSLSVTTTSGDVALGWTGDRGFTMEFDTASGEVEILGDLEIVHTIDGYRCGDGSSMVWIDTSSGDLTFL